MGLLDKYYRINQVAGINIEANSDGSTSIHLCLVAASGNKLDIVEKAPVLTTVEQLKEYLPAKTIIALNLSGKAVLQKVIEKIETIDRQNFNSVIPNANIDNFYVQNFISGDMSFISIIRKTEADQWIKRLSDFGFKTLMLSLGAFPIENIIPQLNTYEGDFTINGYSISRNKKSEWLKCLYDPSVKSLFPIKLGSEKIDEKLVIPYAVALQTVLAGSIEPIQADIVDLRVALDKKLSDIKLKVQGTVLLAIFFIILLGNYTLFTWLNSSNKTLTDQISIVAQDSDTLQKITAEIQEKENRVSLLGWDSGINKSFLIDQVTSLLPEDIRLSAIDINPVNLMSSRQERSTRFYDRKLVIAGSSDEIIPVNEWIARIKTRSWVKSVKMQTYAFDPESNKGRFVISVNY